MRHRQPGKSPTPLLWLISDARNDALLERAIARLPLGSGLVFRHYHLAPDARRARFDRLAKLIRLRGGMIVLAGDARTARRWRADGVYGPTGGAAGVGLLRLITVHDLKELRQANCGQANCGQAVRRRTQKGSTLALISPVFPTCTHPGGKSLGVARFAGLARLARMPVIALGGMTRKRANQIAAATDGWAAIDGLSR